MNADLLDDLKKATAAALHYRNMWYAAWWERTASIKNTFLFSFYIQKNHHKYWFNGRSLIFISKNIHNLENFPFPFDNGDDVKNLCLISHSHLVEQFISYQSNSILSHVHIIWIIFHKSSKLSTEIIQAYQFPSKNHFPLSAYPFEESEREIETLRWWRSSSTCRHIINVHMICLCCVPSPHHRHRQ